MAGGGLTRLDFSPSDRQDTNQPGATGDFDSDSRMTTPTLWSWQPPLRRPFGLYSAVRFSHFSAPQLAAVCLLVGVLFGLGQPSVPSVLGQIDSTAPANSAAVERMLAAGEYSLALSNLAAGSGSGGDEAERAAYQRVWEHRQRSERLGWDQASLPGGDHRDVGGSIGGRPTPTGPGGGLPAGAAGGMVQADFDSLIELIRTVVEPESWDEGGGAGTIQTFQNGVLIDVAGQLRLSQRDLERTPSSLDGTAAPQWVPSSEQRFLSLPKLEAQLQRYAALGQPLPDACRYLGGLYEIQAVVIDPETNDLFLVGPAGPWQVNAAGIAVNQDTGRPVLVLDDLVVALRNVMLGRGVLGCSIDPRPGQFEQAAALASKWNLTVPQVKQRFLTTVGPQDAMVFGVPADSHAAHVLLTADYHIKLLAMGSVGGGPHLRSYLDRCQMDDAPTELIRWWFTLGEPSIHTSSDGRQFTLAGSAMELKTEAKFLAGRAAAGQAAPPRSLAAESFVTDFNQRLPELRRIWPVYGQLENLFTLSLVAHLIHQQQLAQQVGWQPDYLVGRTGAAAGNTAATMTHALQRYPQIKEVELVVNHRSFPLPAAADGRQQRQTVVAISGGVDIRDAAERLRAGLLPATAAIDQQQRQLQQAWEQTRAELQPARVGREPSPQPWFASRWFTDRPATASR